MPAKFSISGFIVTRVMTLKVSKGGLEKMLYALKSAITLLRYNPAGMKERWKTL